MDLMTMNNWNFCEELESLQQDHLLTDCILVAQEDGHEIQAHQNVLAARSPFFRSLFVRKRQELADLTVKIRVELNCPTTPVYGDTVKLVVSYAYTGKVRLTRCSLEAVFLVADYWILPGLMQLCCEYLTGQLDTTNCLGIWRLAKIYGQTELSTRAKRFALRCMSECAKSPEFQQLTSLELRSLLADDYLNVPSEDKVVEIIYKWVGNSRYRRMNVSDLLFTVRMGLSQLDRPLTLHNLMLRPRIPHEILFTVGGWTNGSPTNCIETYDHKAHCWFPTKMAVDKNPRAYHGLAVLNGLLYTIGGFDGTDYFNSVRRFDPQTCEWCEVAPMYTARCYVSVAVLNGLIFAVGGFNGFDRLNTAERYDPTRNQWTLVSPMHKPRSDASLATFNGLLYVVGGFDGQEVLNSVEVYDPNLDKWNLLDARLSCPRSGVNLVALSDCLLAIGGFDGHNRLRTVEKFDARQGQWTIVAPMKTRRSNFGSAVLNGFVYVMGGFNGVVTIALSERYDPEKDRWDRCAPLNFNRSALRASVVEQLSNPTQFSFHSNYDLNPG